MSLVRPDGRPILPAAAFQRHIAVDNTQQTIFIQVMLCGPGQFRQDEYNNILNGRFHEYLPAELRGPVSNMVNNGFKVKPISVDFGAANKDYYLLQYRTLEVVNDGNKSPIPFIKQ